MARDILRASDAIDRARDVNSGLEALASLIVGCNKSDIPDSRGIAELISAVHLQMSRDLDEADRYLSQ